MGMFLKAISTGGVVVLTLFSVAPSTTAVARDGGAIAGGVIGGLALGAIAGSAIANSNRGYYAPAYGAPVYGAPVYGGGCYFQRQAVYDDYGDLIGHRRVRVCE